MNEEELKLARETSKKNWFTELICKEAIKLKKSKKLKGGKTNERKKDD